ncbi:dihydrofolate reductase [Halobacteriales archaeon SW_10_68_16]|jgi:dihydrofolate reductase|nr:MAG: dihydrofolate reductase [Halobacteriales archaeon SW_10_68_16]
MEVAIIVAVAKNGVIGADGEMPWYYPADLQHFKRETTGHPVILGRTTFEAIADRLGGPLPDRTNVVLSGSDPDVPEGVVVAEGIEAALAAARETGADTAYVVGGATVYEQFLPRADRLLVTRVPESVEGDTYWPGHDADRWVETGRESIGEDLEVVTYRARDSEHGRDGAGTGGTYPPGHGPVNGLVD